VIEAIQRRNACATQRGVHFRGARLDVPDARKGKCECARERGGIEGGGRGHEQFVFLAAARGGDGVHAGQNWKHIEIHHQSHTARGSDVTGIGKKTIRDVDRRVGIVGLEPLRGSEPRLGPGEAIARPAWRCLATFQCAQRGDRSAEPARDVERLDG
jgi:hypothetical protein